MTDREIPHSLEAERAALGAAILSHSARMVLLSDTVAGDFYLPKHQAIHHAMATLTKAGIVGLDAVVLADELDSMGQLDNVGGPPTLIHLQGATPATSSIRRYCRIVAEHATHRRLIGAGQEIVEMGYSYPEDVAATVDAAKAMLADVAVPIGQADPSMDLDTFLASGTDEYNWLVPGLLERQDRLILTGGEGFGKSTLLRQMEVQMASGIHPFSLVPIDPVRVLKVDLENTEPQSRRKYRGLRAIAGDKFRPDNLRIEVKTQGIDLMSRADKQWLIERVAANTPDVLVIGPVYKMHLDDPNTEGPARNVAGQLDFIRETFGVTVLMEAHSPHMAAGATKRNLRPIGASMWLRWPEFGYGLAPSTLNPNVAEVEAWRGPRDARSWPTLLGRGNPGTWPWQDIGGQDRDVDL